MQELVKELILMPTIKNGMSDSTFMRIAGRIAKRTGNTLEAVTAEFDRQFDVWFAEYERSAKA